MSSPAAADAADSASSIPADAATTTAASTVLQPTTTSAATTTTSSSSSFPSSVLLSSVPAFPHAGLLPKQETQADVFLASHPSCDGRGVLVAIFDTGTDVAAAGLRVTTDGKPKIVEAVDCSGSGDVDVSVTVTASRAEGEREEAAADELETLSGRRVRGLGAKDGEYWLGLKRAYELFPDSLVSRLRRLRRRRWEDAQRRLETALHRQLHEQEDGSKERADCELRCNEVKAMAKQYDDPGPVLDVVVFRTAEDDWAAVIVSEDERGDAVVGRRLRDYRLHQEFSTFSGDDLCNFTVNIDAEARRCQIVVPAGAHGTHVSAIVAAHFPDQPELNGQAPGAQLVSVKIGDSRLGSMETGVGLMRGLLTALRCRVDLINMSYGEAAAQCDVGRFPDAVREIINKFGVLFVCSAGNAGPALTTAGSPGATTSDVIGVGAYVSPAMMLADYSLRRQLAATQYTWSSRGPSSDGALGVCISAPGGAITSVPTFTLQGMQIMHGTSMASPSAASALSLLLSACKQRGLSYSPHRIRRAIENTACPVPGFDALTVGCGLIQVDAAWQWLERFSSVPDLDVAFRVSVGLGRGVYLREKEETNKTQELIVTVEPAFMEKEGEDDDEPLPKRQGEDEELQQPAAVEPPVDTVTGGKTEEETKEESSTEGSPVVHISSSPSRHNVAAKAQQQQQQQSLSYRRNQSKVQFQVRVALVNPCPAFIDCPSHLMLLHGGRSFTISVHPQRLQPGLHHTSILAFDSTAPDRGPLFRIPVTVVVPERAHGGGNRELMAPLVLGGGAASADGAEAELVPSFPTPIASFTATPRHHFLSPASSSPSPALPAPGIHYHFPSLPFSAGSIHRKFVLIPDGASWAEFTLTGHGMDTARHFMFHCLFLLPDHPYRDNELNKYFSLQSEEEQRFSLDVVGGRTLEIALAQYWNVDGESAVDVDVAFHGIRCTGGEEQLHWDGSEGVHRVDLITQLRSEAVCPVLTVKHAQQPLRPSSSHLSALSAADVLPGNRQVYQLLLTYQWECKEDSVKAVCRLPLLQSVLYESVYESQLVMWFDANKRLEGTGDAWPKELSVRRGRHTLRLQVRHDDVAMLDRLRDMIALVEVTLPKPIELACYASFNSALQAGSKWGEKRTMKAGQRRGLWIVCPDAKTTPAWCRAGDVLLGTMTLAKQGDKAAAPGKSGALHFKITVPPPVAPEKKDSVSASAAAGKKAQDKKAAAKKEMKEVKDREKEAEEEKQKVEEAVVEEKMELQQPQDTDQKKETEVVRPVITEEQKAAMQHAKDKDGIQVSIGAFERKEAGSDGDEAEAAEKEDGKDGDRAATVSAKEIEEEIRDLQVDYIAGLRGSKKQAAFQQLFPVLQAKHPNHLPLLLLRAETAFDAFAAATPANPKTPQHSPAAAATASSPQAAAAAPAASQLPSSASPPSLQSVLDACDAVLSELDQTDIAAHFGRLLDRDDPSLVSVRHRYEEQRDAVVTALSTKLQALRHAGVRKEDREQGEGRQRADEFERVYTELASWADVGAKGDKRRGFAALTAVFNELRGRWGAALRQLNASIPELAAGEGGRELYEERLLVLRGLLPSDSEQLVQHWLRYEQAWNLLRFPRDYTLF